MALYDSRELLDVLLYSEWNENDIDVIVKKYGVNACIYSSVSDVSDSVVKYIQKVVPLFFFFDDSTLLPVRLAYETPSTLGRDRIAAVVGASCLYEDSQVLVIDAGTCITYDFLDKDVFVGGNIAPGLYLRLKSLNTFTKRLPMISPVGEVPFFGYDTATAIRSGVINGLVYEIEGYIVELKNKYPSLFVFLTGGDAFLFAEKLKSSIFVDKNLVLKGLNRILDYNVEK